MLIVHVIILLRRLRALGQGDLAQDVFDTLFSDLDQGLREMGVGDLSVPKRIKPMAEAFYGRAQALEGALAPGAAPEDLAEILRRNVPDPGAEAGEAMAGDLAAYIRALDAALNTADLDDVAAGRVAWPMAGAPS